MYCSSCGGQIGEGLNFCSRCGKRVQELRAATPSAADNLIGALGYVGGGGFLGFFIMLAVLLKKGIPPEFLTLMAALYLATLFGICFLILRQGNILSGKTKRSEAAPADEYSPPSLRPAQLDEPRDLGIGSVTEHTTKTLDGEAFVKRK